MPSTTWHPPSADQDRESSDQILVTGMADCVEDALRLLIQKHAAAMYLVARRILGSYATDGDIEEVLSESFTRAWYLAKTYNPERGSVFTWLRVIVTSRALTRRKNLARVAQLMSELVPDYTDMDTDAYERIDEATDAKTLLYSLMRQFIEESPKDAELIIRHYFQQQSRTAIAEDLGLSADTLRVRLHRAIKKLRTLVAATAANLE